MIVFVSFQLQHLKDGANDGHKKTIENILFALELVAYNNSSMSSDNITASLYALDSLIFIVNQRNILVSPNHLEVIMQFLKAHRYVVIPLRAHAYACTVTLAC